MADRKPTIDEDVAERIGSAIDGQIFRLEQEKIPLLNAAERLAEIDATIASLQAEKVRIDPRRKPREPNPETPPIREK